MTHWKRFATRPALVESVMILNIDCKTSRQCASGMFTEKCEISGCSLRGTLFKRLVFWCMERAGRASFSDSGSKHDHKRTLGSTCTGSGGVCSPGTGALQKEKS